MSENVRKQPGFNEGVQEEMDQKIDRTSKSEKAKSAAKKTGKALLHMGDAAGQITVKSSAVLALSIIGYYLVAQLGLGMLAGIGVLFSAGVLISYTCRGVLNSTWSPSAFLESLQPSAA